MKSLFIAGFDCFLSSAAMAGEIYGTIEDAGKPVSAGVKVEATAAGNTYAGQTDQFGAYHTFAAAFASFQVPGIFSASLIIQLISAVF